MGVGEPPLGAHPIHHLASVDQMATLADSISFFELDAKTGRKRCQAQNDTDVRAKLSSPQSQDAYENVPHCAGSLVWVETFSSLLMLYYD